MAILNITRANIASLPAIEGLWRDDRLPNFCYRQRKPDARGKCHASFFVGYRFGGEQKKYKLGDATVLSADAARKLALVVLGQIAAGIDPQAAKDAQRIEQAKLTFAEAVEQYLQMKAAELRPASLRTCTLYLSGAAYFPNLHRKALDSIDRADIAPNLDRINSQSGAPSASRARAHLSSFFAWSLRRGYCNENPVIQTEEPKAAEERTRALSGEEIRQVWNACGDNDYGRLVRLLILTGCRREEIGALRWDEIDLNNGTITLPAERCKNGREHVIPLSGMALDIIKAIPRREGFVFGTRGGGFKIWTHGKKALLASTGEMAPWRLHDIRHAVSTGLHEIGVEPQHVEAVLNHVSGHKEGVAGRYNHATYRAQMAQALSRWADHVHGIIHGHGDKVVALRRSA
jgi:integrase